MSSFFFNKALMNRFSNFTLMEMRLFSLPLKSSCIGPVLQLCCIVQHVASAVDAVDMASNFFIYYYLFIFIFVM